MSGNVTPLTGKQSEKPKLNTITSLESVYTVGPSAWWRMNPDQLVKQKGLKVYAQMRFDDQVKAATTFKRDAIVSRGWTLSYDDASALSPEEQAKRIDLMEDIIDAYPGSFTDAINSVALGRDFGFSLVEKVFSPVLIDDGQAIGISSLRYRDPTTFEFVTDGYGTLVEFRQRAGGQLTVLDINDFIYYVHAPENDPFYGSSDLRAAYKSWYAKGAISDYWLIYLERLGGGFPVLTAKDSTAPTPGTPGYSAMQTVLANLKSSAGILVPAGMEFKLEQLGSTGAFQEAITFFDLAIARSMLVPNLVGVSHTGQTGAFAQSQTQLEAFYWTLAEDQARLESVLNEQLFKPLARYNFADGDGPAFKFKPLSEERLKWLVTTWSSLITGGAVVATEEDEAYLRKLLDMPDRDDKATVLVTPAQQLAQDTMQANADAKAAQLDASVTAKSDAAAAKMAALETQIETLSVRMAALNAPSATTINVSPTPPVGVATAKPRSTQGHDTTEGREHVHVHADPKSCTRAAFSRAVQRVAFAVIEKRQSAASALLVQDAAKFVAKTVSRLVGDNGTLSTIIASPEQIPSITFSGDEVGKLKAIFRRSVNASYVEGGAAAKNEIERSGQPSTFASVRDVAAEYLDSNAFRLAGNVSDATRGIMQQELLNAVKNGSSVKDTRTAIWNRLVAKGMTSEEQVLGFETDEGVIAALDALWVDNESQAATYLSTLARTNLFDAFNEGRFSVFTDPALGGFVEALEYSAVLDDHTTDLCMQLDTSIWATDSPNWDTFKPPNHWNSVPASSTVDTLRGKISIMEVMAGDHVLTHRGRYRPVYAVMRKPSDHPLLLAIKTDTGRELRTTGEHPVLTTRGWKRADDLQLGDVLFEHVENMAGVDDVILPDPKHFPSLFDQEIVAYEVVSSALGTLMGFPVEFENHLGVEESIVSDIAVDDELELVSDTAGIEQGREDALRSRRLVAHGKRLSVDDVGAMRVPRVVQPHSFGDFGAFLTERPMQFSGASGAAMRSDFHKNDLVWKAATIISIAAIECDESLWNLAVLDDESYVAEGIIVHNCRSILIAVTQVDAARGDWDGQESLDPPAGLQPADGFGAGEK